MIASSDILTWLRRFVAQPGGEFTRFQRTVRYLVDFGRHCAKTLANDRAPQMAAALTYRTIFSLVPTLVLVLLVFTSLGDQDKTIPQIKENIYEILNIDALSRANLRPAAPDEQAPPRTEAQLGPEDEDNREAESRKVISELIDGYIAKAQNLSFKGIGTIGVVVLIWAALALVITVEQCFNRVYNANRGRAWYQKIMIYWALLTLGPVLMTVSTHLAGQLTRVAIGTQVPTVLEAPPEAPLEVPPETSPEAPTDEPLKATPTPPVTMDQVEMSLLGSALKWAGRFTALGASWLLLFLLYVLMPATSVHLRPAAIGSFVAAILWELAKGGFKLYVAKASFTSVYGSLGLVPLFLFWLYLSWLIVLFGLEISYSLQTLGGYRVREHQSRLESQFVGDPLWLVQIMAGVARAFAAGGSADAGNLSQDLGLPERTVRHITAKLEEAGLLHRVQAADGEEAGYAPARPPQDIRVAQILELGQKINTSAMQAKNPSGQREVNKIIEAQRQAVGDATLADAIKE